MSKAPSEKLDGRNSTAQIGHDGLTAEVPVIDAASGKAPDAAVARSLFHQRAGQLFLALTRLARYRDIPAGDLKSLFLQPLIDDRIAFAHRDGDGATAMPIGMAVWASVSDSVAERIAADANANTFPVRMEAQDWTSGETIWLLDLLVPDQKAGTAVFMNFGKLIEGRSFRAHPVVWGMVDKSITDKFADLRPSAPAPNAS